jgi:GxxExxY protein
MTWEEFYRRNAGADEPWDDLSERVIGAAIEVHRHVGPGMTEDMYENGLAPELDLRGIRYARQVEIPVEYKGKRIGKTRLDFLVEERLIVELKACERLNEVHRAQCICYLRATGLRVALLINFNVPILKDSIKRVVLTR